MKVKLINFYFAHSIFKGEHPIYVISWKKPLTLACIQILETDLFQTGYHGRDHLVLQFDISLDDIDLYSRSQLYERKKSASIFLQI